MTIEPLTIRYAVHPTRRRDREFLADLYLPGGSAPANLLTWMHSGGFRSGRRQYRNHALLAAEFARHGYATTFIDDRLARSPGMLRRRTTAALAAFVADAEAAGEEMHPTFYGLPRACGGGGLLRLPRPCRCRRGRSRAFGPDAPRRQFGRCDLGAERALPARVLGLFRPPVATVFAVSGGFAYPSHLSPGARILALHAPGDTRVPISSIRRLAAHTADQMLLIEAAGQRHGEPTLSPREPLAAAVARLVEFDRAPEPLTLPFGPSRGAERC